MGKNNRQTISEKQGEARGGEEHFIFKHDSREKKRKVNLNPKLVKAIIVILRRLPDRALNPVHTERATTHPGNSWKT